MSETGSTIETIKNAADAAKSLIIIMAILLVIFGHRYVDVILNRYNVTKLDFGGVTIDRAKAIEALATNADKLPEAQTALMRTSLELRTLQRKYGQLSAALAQTKEALSLAQSERPVGMKGTADTTIHKAQLNAEVAIAESRVTLASAKRIARAAEQAEQSTRDAVRSLPRSQSGPPGFAIVFGGDHTLGAAEDQANLARRRGIQAAVYLRQHSYRSISVFTSRQQAAAALPKISAINSYAEGAYIVNLRSWCPAPNDSGRYFDCGI